ncbi:MAG: Imm49 family immunity protein [Polyangiaceae bacterium]
MLALLDNDEESFNAHLFEAEGTQGLVGLEGNAKDPDALFRGHTLALAAMAYDRGMKVEVESPYILRWFIEGRDPEESYSAMVYAIKIKDLG